LLEEIDDVKDILWTLKENLKFQVNLNDG
jgi:hypothetical protein